MDSSREADPVRTSTERGSIKKFGAPKYSVHWNSTKNMQRHVACATNSENLRKHKNKPLTGSCLVLSCLPCQVSHLCPQKHNTLYCDPQRECQFDEVDFWIWLIFCLCVCFVSTTNKILYMIVQKLSIDEACGENNMTNWESHLRHS